MAYLGIVLATVGALLTPFSTSTSSLKWLLGTIGIIIWISGPIYTFVNLDWQWALITFLVGFIAYWIGNSIYGERA